MTTIRPERLRGSGGPLRWLCLACAVAAVVALAGCGSSVDAGGFSSSDRAAAQDALDALQGSNIATQLIDLTATAGLAPAACRVHLQSRKPLAFKVYVFWVPFSGPQSYSWLDMTVLQDATQDQFHLGTAPAQLPGGSGSPSPGSGATGTVQPDYNPLSTYGPHQKVIDRQVMIAHAGDAFSKPAAQCQVLMNGDLRLLPAG